MDDIDVMEGLVEPEAAPTPDVQVPESFDPDAFLRQQVGDSANYSQDVNHPANRVRFAGDSSLLAQFSLDTQLDRAASIKAGRPIYKEVDRVRITVPGNKLSIIDRIATRSDIDRFPGAYKAYKDGQPHYGDGLPLKHWPEVGIAQVEELAWAGCHTVEQLAQMTDGNIGRLGMGYRDLKNKAQAWLNKSGDKDARIAELEERLEKLEAAPESKRRGRSPKTLEE